ncbi:MAG: sigma 54-interacting transcriptional regulator [Clostridia bacterium]|nr:sigma 54-interacting transcriptional regulator [Clostridia bacterium]
MGIFRLRIEFEDRAGMVYDTSQVINKYKISISALEVMPETMYFELECDDVKIKEDIILDLALIPNIKKVEEVKCLQHPNKSNDEFGKIIGESDALKKAIIRSRLVADTDSTVLILGESGTGKELFAKAIHSVSNRAEHPFYPVNCAALPETLLESELFGYEDGAFSGAKRGGKAGLLEVAHKGTVFFDEVGDLTLGTQAKLLRAIQEMKIRRIGGYKEKSIDIRIIAATNRDLWKMAEQGKFREDLYYRLNVVPVKIPPLRERRADIPILAEHFLLHYARATGKPTKTLTARALAFLVNYDWPGNVRELQNMIERAISLNPGRIIDLDKFAFEEDNYLEFSYQEDKPLKTLVEQLEYKVIEETLQRHGSIRKSAKALGISHTALLKKIEKLKKKKAEW